MKRPKDSRHHRKPVSLNGSSNPENISMVTVVCHQSWHAIFRNMTPWEIAKEINTVWLDPDYKMVVRKR